MANPLLRYAYWPLVQVRIAYALAALGVPPAAFSTSQVVSPDNCPNRALEKRMLPEGSTNNDSLAAKDRNADGDSVSRQTKRHGAPTHSRSEPSSVTYASVLA